MSSVFSRPVLIINNEPAADSYYHNFSKYVIQQNSNDNNDTIVTPYQRSDWVSDPNSINGLKLPELKRALKHIKAPSSGNKSTLKTRLIENYQKFQYAIKIQRTFRGYIAFDSERIRGPAYKNRSLCVNDTDFHTMDSVLDIPRETFFSYCNEKGFVYGFNVFSLMRMFKQTRKFINPYNREDIPIGVICRIFSLYKKIGILYPLVFRSYEVDFDNNFIVNEITERVNRPSSSSDWGDVIIPDTFDIISDHNSTIISEEDTAFEARLSEDIHDRAVALFNKIGELIGVIVRVEWFLHMSRYECIRFYHYYRVWWNFANSMTEYEKREMTGLSSHNLFLSQIDDTMTEDRCRDICLELMEIMVYNGADARLCKLGAKQVIMMLTVVSTQARMTRPELYEEFL